MDIKKSENNMSKFYDINKAMENEKYKIVIEFAPKGFGKEQYKFEKIKNRIKENMNYHKQLMNDFKFIGNTDCTAYTISEHILSEYEEIMKGIE